MPWIKTIGLEEATGRLRRSYDAGIRRSGRVFGILKTMSLAPPILDASMGLYMKVMGAEVGISRRQRELLATVVSSFNDCHY